MKIDLSQFRQTFLQESADHLETMEAGLLALRSAPSDIELLNAIFRSAHSIKGGAGSFGFNRLVRFTHALESLLDRLRSEEMAADEAVILLLLDSVDVLRSLLAAGEDQAPPAAAAKLVEQIEALTAAHADPQHTLPTALKDQAQPDHALLYTVEFRPAPELFASGTNPIMLLRNLAALGTVRRCTLHGENLPGLADLNPAQCYLSWTLELVSDRPEGELREVFEFVEHLAEVRIECAASAPAELGLALSSQQAPALASAVAIEIEAPEEPLPAGARQCRSKQAPPRRAAGPGAESGSIRVATEKVDRLIDLVGELVTAHVMAEQMVEEFTPACLPRLREAVLAMKRNSRELHERVMGVRMLPIGTLFQRYVRTVYDIARSTGKQIRLETDGEDAEIDKSMLEMLGDPLTHLVRNAADHGIEAPEIRRKAGKPQEGEIQLRAFHRAGRVVIEITDDGAGIDPERVRRKAVERGLISAEAQLSDQQLRMLIFEAGFSTRDSVTDLSGRGVGMDVVKRNIQQMNGTVTLASELGRGSTVTLELPLTLAILEGLLVRVADRTLVLPLLSVLETVAPAEGQLVQLAECGEVVRIREQSIPVMRLRRFLGMTAGADEGQRGLVVVVETDRRQFGLVVDELLGQQQVVMKSLERNLRKVDGLMGATILGDGSVAPVLDVASIAGLDLFGLDRHGQTPLLPRELPPTAGSAAGMRANGSKAGKSLSEISDREPSLCSSS